MLALGVAGCLDVTLEPTVAVVTSELGAGRVLIDEDVMLDEGTPGTELGSGLVLGARGTTSPPSRRTLLRVSPINLTTEVNGRDVTYAELRVYSPSISGTFTLSRVPSEHGSWSEARSNWGCEKDTSPGNGTADCATSWSSSLTTGEALGVFKSFTGEPGWVKFLLTAEVLSMLGTSEHPGFLITGDELNPGAEFVSSETTIDTTHTPRLILTLADDNFAPVEPTPPPLDRSSVSHVIDAMDFLLDPEYGLQLGYDPGAFDPTRAAVARGRVYHRDTGDPIPGVRVTVLGDPSVGEARTRIGTGNYEIMFNGGGTLTLRFEHDGFFTVDRTIEAPWDTWVPVPDIAMVPLSELSCTATINSTGGVFAGPSRTDERGTRAVALYIPPSTTVAEEGSSALTQFQICIGEYTLSGATSDAAEAMPAELPSATSYTYASALEVVPPGLSPLVHANHLTNPTFNHDIFYYLRVDGLFDPPDGLSAIPPGTRVPNGLYERSDAMWSADDDGITIAVSAAATDCVDMGMTEVEENAILPPAEETVICGSPDIAPGTYWRVPMDRFSIRDYNYWGSDLDVPIPDPDVAGGDSDPGCSATASGSIIHCEAQALGESLPIAGTGMSLSYLSDRQAGRLERFRAVTTPLPPSRLPDELPVGVTVSLFVGGRGFLATDPSDGDHGFSAAQAQSPITIEWDGLDAYHRRLIGPQVGFLRIGYEYPLRYREPPPPPSFALRTAGTSLIATGRGTGIIYVTRRVVLGVLDEREVGIGGWDLDLRHHYDAAGGRVHFGDGTRLDSANRASILSPTTTLSSTRTGFAADVNVSAVGPDGSLYYWSHQTGRVRRVPLGSTTPVDVAPEVFARVTGLAVGRHPNGLMLYVAEEGVVGGSERLHRYSLLGGGHAVLFSHAGTVRPSGSAVIAAADFDYQSPGRIVAMRDGTLLVFDGVDALRYWETDGQGYLQRVPWSLGAAPTDTAMGPDGAVYFAVSGDLHRLHQGLLTPFLTMRDGDGTDGLPIDEAGVGRIDDVSVDRRGNVCYLERATTTTRVRCIVDGIVSSVLGGGSASDPLEVDAPGEVSATRIRLNNVFSVNYLPDGALAVIMAGPGTSQVFRRLGALFPADVSTTHVVPAGDASVVHDFDGRGAHTATRDAITSVSLVRFAYDSLGRLDYIVDAENATTDVQWLTGEIRLVAPGNVVTNLFLNADGYVERYRDPAGSEVTFTYGAPGPGAATLPGLLTRMVDARGGEHRYTYDPTTGRLLTDRAPLDTPSSPAPVQTLSMRAPWTDPATGTTWDSVTLSEPDDPLLDSTAELTRYLVRSPSPTRMIRETRHASAWTRATIPADGSAILNESWDGTSSTTVTGPDPRPGFGLASAYPVRVTTTRPSGATTITTEVTSLRSWNAGTSTLTTSTTVPSALGGTSTTTFTSAIARAVPSSAGFVTTTTSPPLPGTTTNVESRVFTDTRGRVFRIETPGMYPTCIEYPSTTAVRPSLVRTSPGTASGDVTRGPCNATASTRRETRYDYATGGLRWLTGIREGSTGTTLNTTIVPDLRGWTDTMTLPGRTSVIDVIYDAEGNITSFTPPGRSAHTFTYTPRGALATETPPGTPAWPLDEEVVRTEYRANGSLLEQEYRTGAVVRTTLEPATGYLRRLEVVGEPGNTFDFANDAGGRPTSVDGRMGNIAFTYGGGLLETETWTLDGAFGVAGSITRTVGANLLLGRETVSITHGTTTRTAPIDYAYDTGRRLTRAQWGTNVGMHLSRVFSNGATLTARAGLVSPGTTDLTTEYDTDALGEYAYATTRRSTTLTFEERVCARDEHGRVTSRMERIRTTSGRWTVRTYRYDYSTRGFLERYREYVPQTAGTTEGASIPCPTFTNLVADTGVMTYDDAGNRSGLAVNAADQAETGTRTYDALGQLFSRGTRQFRYDTFGRLRWSSDGTSRVDYDYDPLGRLTAIRPSGSSTVPLQRFLYRDGLNPVAWQRATTAPGTCPGGMDNVFFIYASREHTPDLMHYDVCGDGTIDATYRLLTDERGSVRNLVDVVTGNTVEQYLYDAWGNPRTADLVPTGGTVDTAVRLPTRQPFGFTGGIWDRETGLWRLGARDYDPAIGRWTTRDPIGFDGGYNLYAYCDQDPVNCIDVTGLDWTDTGLHVFNALDRWGVIDFAAGFGDSLSFGLTRAIRDGTGVGGVDYCSTAYAVGEWTEIGLELALTGGAAALRRRAASMSRSAVRAAAASRVRPLLAPNRFVHHVNALFGHPGRPVGLLPLAPLPAWIHSARWNLVSLDAAAHALAHRNARAAEWLLENTVMRPGLTAARAARDAVW